MEQLIGCAPEYICQLLQQDRSGCVEMVNSRGIYLCLGEKRILLCHSRYGTVPNGICLEQWAVLPPLLTAGEEAWVEKGVLHTRSHSWKLALRSIAREGLRPVPEAQSRQAALALLLERAKPTGLSSLVYPLFTGHTPEMNVYCRAALPQVEGLLQALKNNDPQAVYSCVSALLGLGPGLTPSGDDLLGGLLYGLRRAGRHHRVLTAAIRALAPQQTNAVSADFLLALSEDAPFAAMAAAWDDPKGSAEALLEIGNNSGSEMLLGLLCAATL